MPGSSFSQLSKTRDFLTFFTEAGGWNEQFTQKHYGKVAWTQEDLCEQ